MQSSGASHLPLEAMNTETTWPSPFRYPVEQLQPGLLVELNKNKIDLNDTSDSYKNSLRKSLLQILCMEAIRILRYPNILQKNDLAKCIIDTWPHLMEPNGNGYERWLEGINATLNTTRQAMGYTRLYQKRKNNPTTPPSCDSQSSGSLISDRTDTFNNSSREKWGFGATDVPSFTGKGFIQQRP